MVRRHEGEESARIAARWFSHQPQGVQVFRDSSGTVTGFNCFVTLLPEEREWSMFDPCAQAIWHFLDTARPPLAPGQLVTVDRFWMDTNAYQALSPTQGMIFVTATRYVLTTLAWPIPSTHGKMPISGGWLPSRCCSSGCAPPISR